MRSKTFYEHLKDLDNSKVVPRSFSTDMECIKFIMYFIHPHLDIRFAHYEPWNIFLTFYEMNLRNKQIMCHQIKTYVNDGSLHEALHEIERCIIHYNKR